MLVGRRERERRLIANPDRARTLVVRMQRVMLAWLDILAIGRR